MDGGKSVAAQSIMNVVKIMHMDSCNIIYTSSDHTYTHALIPAILIADLRSFYYCTEDQLNEESF